MSLCQPSLPGLSTAEPLGPRKRTSSFSCLSPAAIAGPRPSKTPRLSMSLAPRADSSALSELFNTTTTTHSHPISSHRSVRSHKELKDRRRSLHRATEHTDSTSFSSLPDPLPSTPECIAKPKIVAPPTPVCRSASSTFRTSSPLAPMRNVLPARPVFPRSKAEPDLYKQAIKARMQCSPEGKKVLHMGPRLAISIAAATRELERIVAAQQEREREMFDVMMDDMQPILSNSWVMIPGEDWEMVDCSA